MALFSSKPLVRIASFILFPLIFVLSAECILRLKGEKPFVPQTLDVVFEPTFIFAPSTTFGYTLKPGNFRFTMGKLDNFTFQPTHTADSTRATSADLSNNDQRPFICLFGASYTYGVGVEDSSTFAWRLQKKRPDLNIVNYGIPGYGPIHAYLRLKGLLRKKNRPAFVILNYSYYHDNTNTLPRISRESIVRFSNLANKEFIARSLVPYFETEGDSLILRYIPYDSFYSEWPLRQYSALVNFMEIKYNQMDEKAHNSHRISKKVILRIAELCRDNNISFALAGITNDQLTQEMLTFCSENDILNLDISVNLERGSKYRIHEFDSHPNGKAHSIYTEKLLELLSR